MFMSYHSKLCGGVVKVLLILSIFSENRLPVCGSSGSRGLNVEAVYMSKPNRTTYRFMVQLVEPVGPVWFLKHCSVPYCVLIFYFDQSLIKFTTSLLLDNRLHNLFYSYFIIIFSSFIISEPLDKKENISLTY